MKEKSVFDQPKKRIIFIVSSIIQSIVCFALFNLTVTTLSQCEIKQECDFNVTNICGIRSFQN